MQNVTNIDVVDKQRLNESMSHVSKDIQSWACTNETTASLVQDTFASLYKYSPIIANDVPSDCELNKRILSEMMGLNEYQQLRNFTIGDTQAAAAGVDIVKPIWDSMPESIRECQQNIEQIAEQIEQALESDTYDPSTLESLFSNKSNAVEQLQTQMDEWSDDIRQVIRRSLAEQEQDTADGEQAMAALGWGSSGSKGPQTKPEDKLAVMQALKQNKKLKEIMKLAGRMTNLAQKKQRQKSQYFRTEMVGIEQGDDLSLTIPSEFGYFIHDNPALNTLFLKRLSNAELFQYEMESREPKAQGPVICAIDCSGSMSGEPDIWSKACGLALYSIARMQKRDFSMILFNHAVEKIIYIPKGEYKSEQMIAVLCHGVSGGTSFEEPLSKACDMIKTDGHKKADLIVISDGLCDITEQFRAEYMKTKKSLEFSTYTILIGGSREEETIAKKFSDTTTTLEHCIAKNENTAFNSVFNI
jgi:uncharacterized protein with von Willebrand factor type A (vWA) domain